ncbi:protein amnionless-like [Thrips palmi]|uniref:Protein amnionless n=1 Tax=Thrips palmi TaxID=161013 RepID=A0A6P8ZN49_THRPL|nr:protein amnionless-like [Thrips palmi]
MRRASLLLPLLLVVVKLPHSSAAEDPNESTEWIPALRRKVWRRYALSSDAANWEGGVAPCQGDAVEFPRDMRGATATLQDADRPSELVRLRAVRLPWKGVVSLPLTGGVVLGGEDFRGSACPGRDLRWRVPKSKPAWLDPANWVTAGVLDGDMEAVPHLQRIPCGQDVADFQHLAVDIAFPETHTAVGLVLLDGAVIRSSIELALEHVSAFSNLFVMDFLTFRATSLREVATLEEQCGLVPGAWTRDAAQAAADDLQHAVCSHVTCPPPACARPVRPHHHCCHVCGGSCIASLLCLSRPHGDRLEDVRRVVASEATRYDVRWGQRPAVHVGVVPSPRGEPAVVQVVILGRDAEDLSHPDRGRPLCGCKRDRGAYQQVVSEQRPVALSLSHSHGTGRREHCIVPEPGSTSPLAAELSGLAASSQQSGAAMAPATAASVLGVLLGTLLLAVVAIAVLLYFQDRSLPIATRLADLLGEKQSAFLFARFENTPGEEDNGVVVNVQGKQPAPGVRSARGSWSARSFRNPLFEEEHPDEQDVLHRERAASRGVTHENPLFSELQRRAGPAGPEDRVDEDGGVLELGEEQAGGGSTTEALAETAPAAEAAATTLVDVTL